MLTERTIKTGKHGDKLMDSMGLYLDISPKGLMTWRVRYKRDGKETRKSIGRYPQMSLKEARQKRDELLEYSLTPPVEEVPSLLFGAVVDEWWTMKKKTILSKKSIATSLGRLDRYVIPDFKDRPINSFSPRDLLDRIKVIESQGTVETAHRVYSLFRQIFKYAFARGYIENLPIVDLTGVIVPVRVKHHASLTDLRDIAGLMRAIDAYRGSHIVQCGLMFSAYTFQRPGEIRKAEWSEFDLDAAEWRVPEAKMKMKRRHIIPLSRQVLDLLQRVKCMLNRGPYVFPSERSISRPMSENTITSALRRMGYTKEEMTAHGFRSMASTRLNESGLWSRDAIELQLAHVEGNSVRAAYNYAERLNERREMMQWWSDWLDEVRGA